MPQFKSRSTRPLTAESYRRAADLAESMAINIAHFSAIENPDRWQQNQLTRAIKDLAAHSARLLERHKEQAR